MNISPGLFNHSSPDPDAMLSVATDNSLSYANLSKMIAAPCKSCLLFSQKI